MNTQNHKDREEEQEEELFHAVREILCASGGPDIQVYKDRCIKRRIVSRIRTLGCGGFPVYLERLRNDPQERRDLLEALTIHVSQFFRNPTTYLALEEKVLPDLVACGKSFRIWSVGCASGEEPYSVALLCDELCSPERQPSIVATDISAEIIKTAREGCYTRQRLVEVPASVLENYFEPEGKSYRLQERIRKRVRFYRHDILNDRPFSQLQLILCRNMLIYFARSEQEQILRKFYHALQDGGYLVLGRSESILNACREQFEVVNIAERIYRKRSRVEVET